MWISTIRWIGLQISHPGHCGDEFELVCCDSSLGGLAVMTRRSRHSPDQRLTACSYVYVFICSGSAGPVAEAGEQEAGGRTYSEDPACSGSHPEADPTPYRYRFSYRSSSTPPVMSCPCSAPMHCEIMQHFSTCAVLVLGQYFKNFIAPCPRVLMTWTAGLGASCHEC